MANDPRRLASRFMVGVRDAFPGDPELEADLDACARVGIGGVILFDTDIRSGEPRNIVTKRQVKELIAHVRARLGGSLTIAVDQEGGRVARLKPEHGFPPLPNAREFALMRESEQRDAARAMAHDLRDIGVTMNFAPCVDLDLGCPVISGIDRCYGDSNATLRSARIVIQEMQRAGVSACVKHFPGHGSAGVDSHKALPDVTDVFREEELNIYHSLFSNEHPDESRPHAVMTAHLLHRDLDPAYPASVSPRITTELLREELGFTGVIATDSLDMGALRQRYSLEVAATLALDAGADIIVHACNSTLGETAEDVADMIERLAQNENGNFR